MQPPLAARTLLQNRYLILNVLGQGGFGRTYLAEDQGRFNELCALKELIPVGESEYLLEKSRTLFQREAATLYQIRHPQVPRFQATLEENGRLFLVQDYVEGKTYRTLLNDRKAEGKTFSEAEVLLFLKQMLPVLGHIHSKGIIHRDISPDNIILRESYSLKASEALPVLIDFGVVKELATRFQLASMTTPITTVGKPGYAPSEQFQAGRAYQSSDIYSLGVTALVLLTGKEPQELYDDINLDWQWQRWVRVDDRLAKVLNQSIHYKPRDRYQFAEEALQDLEDVEIEKVPLKLEPVPARVSEMETVAIGRRAERVPRSVRTRYQSEPVISESERRPFWEDPFALIPIVIGLILFAGIASWAMMTLILGNREQSPLAPTPAEFANPIVPSPTTVEETPTPTPTVEPRTEQLNLAVGQTVSQQGFLRGEETIEYVFSGQQGQQLDASLSGEGVLMSILGPDRISINQEAERVLGWRGSLPAIGNYTVQIRPIRGVAQSSYKLDLTLSSSASPSPAFPDPLTLNPNPFPTVPTEFNVQALNLPPGEETIQVSDQISPQQVQRYLVNARPGQLFTVFVEQGVVAIDIRYPNGQLVEAGANVRVWNSLLSVGGEYQIDVKATEETSYTLNVGLRD